MNCTYGQILKVALITTSLCASAKAHAAALNVGCDQLVHLSHERVHAGLTIIRGASTEAERNYFHGKYHKLVSECRSNPDAVVRVQISPKIEEVLAENGFLN
jgi:hypothetical protein